MGGGVSGVGVMRVGVMRREKGSQEVRGGKRGQGVIWGGEGCEGVRGVERRRQRSVRGGVSLLTPLTLVRS